LKVMEDSSSQVKIVILDACRDNPFATSFRSLTRGLAGVRAPRGTYIAFSTGPGEVAVDGDGSHSPYAAALAETMTIPGLKVEETFKLTRQKVLELTDMKQMTWDSSSLTGDFYFRPPLRKMTEKVEDPIEETEQSQKDRKILEAFFSKSKNAILLDARTGKSMYERNSDQPIAPGSMSKIMTALMVFERLADKTLTLDQEIYVSKNAWTRGGMQSGSTMHLEAESYVKLGNLIQGVIVQSANDASIAIAEHISGSEEAFAELMTFRAREIGLRDAKFRNATGASDRDQKISVRELALLTQYIIRKFPNYYPYFRQKFFHWNRITQPNRNRLLLEYSGADGLQGDYDEDSGYGLVGSAIRNNQRLIVVVAGLQTVGDVRWEEQKPLDWGFRQLLLQADTQELQR